MASCLYYIILTLHQHKLVTANRLLTNPCLDRARYKLVIAHFKRFGKVVDDGNRSADFN